MRRGLAFTFALAVALAAGLSACSNAASRPCATTADCGECEVCDPSQARCVPDEVTQECIAACSCGTDGCCDLACEFDADCPQRACPEEDGEVRDVGPLEVGGDVDLVQALWAADHYAIAFYDRPRGAFFARADEDGEIVPGSVKTLDDSGLFTRVDFNGHEHAVVYVDEDESLPDPFEDRQLVFERLTAEGEPIAGSRVPLSADLGIDERPSSPVVAHDPIRFEWLVVWEVQAENAVYAIRLDADGAVVPGSLVRISEEDAFAYLGSGGSTGNVVSWVNGTYVVAWMEGGPGGVHLTRLDPEEGVVSDDVLRQGTNQPFGATVAWSGDELAVAWHDVPEGAEHFTVRFARARADGVFVDGSERGWGVEGAHASAASLAWDGREYAVGWWTQRDADTADLRLTRLSRGGDPTEELILTRDRRPFFPFLTWDGCRIAIAYVDQAPSSWDGRIVFLGRRPVVVE